MKTLVLAALLVAAPLSAQITVDSNPRIELPYANFQTPEGGSYSTTLEIVNAGEVMELNVWEPSGIGVGPVKIQPGVNRFEGWPKGGGGHVTLVLPDLAPLTAKVRVTDPNGAVAVFQPLAKLTSTVTHYPAGGSQATYVWVSSAKTGGKASIDTFVKMGSAGYHILGSKVAKLLPGEAVIERIPDGDALEVRPLEGDVYYMIFESGINRCGAMTQIH